GNTAALAAFAFLLSLLAGSLGGISAGLAHGSRRDRVLSAAFTLAFAVPSYWLGIVFVLVFSVWLGVLPGTGLPPEALAGGWLSLPALVVLLLPGTTLALIPAGVIARSWRTAIADVGHQEFVTALRLRG